jgi:SAM-dependent methyltransferase
MTSEFSIPSDWYQTFFTDPVIRFWDAAVPPPATEAEVGFVIRHVGLRPPAKILDVPCGTGRHALPLSQAGFAVTGFDISEAALSRARASARINRLAVRFSHSNMLEFRVDAPSDALICMGNSIGYFEPTLTQTLFRRFASALRVGSHFILDTSICAESLLPILPSSTLSFPGGSYEREISYDPAESVIKTRAQLMIDGEKHELLYRHFVMTSGELVRSVRSAGFDISALYGDTQDTAFAPGSPRLLLVAIRM